MSPHNQRALPHPRMKHLLQLTVKRDVSGVSFALRDETEIFHYVMKLSGLLPR